MERSVEVGFGRGVGAAGEAESAAVVIAVENRGAELSPRGGVEASACPVGVADGVLFALVIGAARRAVAVDQLAASWV